MTNHAVEQRLRRAAAELPVPEGVERARACKRKRPVVYALAAALIVVLLVPVALAVGGSLGGYPSILPNMGRVEVECPEALGMYDAPSNLSAVNVVETDASWLERMFCPDYIWVYKHYYKNTDESLRMTVGSTDDELWYHCFSYDPADDTPLFEGYDPENDGDAWLELAALTQVEYRGCMVYLYDKVVHAPEDETLPEWRDAEATWVDEEAGLVFHLAWSGTHTSGDGTGVTYVRAYQMLTQEELLEYVKLIIDAQRD